MNPIQDKIRKLLRLAESSNIHEASNAAAHAQKLMEEHKLSRAVLGDIYDEPQIVQQEIADRGKLDRVVLGKFVRNDWRWSLACAVCMPNGCKPWVDYMMETSGRHLVAYGHEHNLATVAYLYQFLGAEIDRLADMLASGEGRRYKNAFRYGAIDTIKQRLSEMQREARSTAKQTAQLTGGSTALVRVEKAIVRMDGAIREVEAHMEKEGKRYRKGKSRVTDGDGYRSGQSVGNRISLNGGRTALR